MKPTGERMVLLRWSIVAALVVVASGSHAQKRVDPESALTPSEQQVLIKLEHANQMEIDAGGLTEARAQSTKVKQYGDQLVKDHEQADDMVRDYADKKGADLSTR